MEAMGFIVIFFTLTSGMGDINSPTWDWTHAPCNESAES